MRELLFLLSHIRLPVWQLVLRVSIIYPQMDPLKITLFTRNESDLVIPGHSD